MNSWVYKKVSISFNQAWDRPTFQQLIIKKGNSHYFLLDMWLNEESILSLYSILTDRILLFELTNHVKSNIIL